MHLPVEANSKSEREPIVSEKEKGHKQGFASQGQTTKLLLYGGLGEK